MENLTEWLENPTTRWVKHEIEKVVQEIKDEWASGKFKNSEENAYALGRIAGLLEIFEIKN